MNKTIQIEIPPGFMIDTFDPAKGEIKFKEKPKLVTERIKTVADVFADNAFTEESFDEQFGSFDQDEQAYIFLKMMAKSLNEGWKPNWDDSNEYKYYPWFYMGGSSGFRCYDFDYQDSASSVGSHLCFKTRELAIYAGNTFTDAYKQFMLIK